MLHLAAQDGELQLFKDLCRHKGLQTSHLVTMTNKNDENVFHCAAKFGQHHMIDELIKKLPKIFNPEEYSDHHGKDKKDDDVLGWREREREREPERENPARQFIRNLILKEDKVSCCFRNFSDLLTISCFRMVTMFSMLPH